MLTLVVDGNNLAYKARHVYQLSHRGEDISVVYGVLNMLLSTIKKLDADSVIVCWDYGVPAYRKQLIPEYKASRKVWEKEDREDFYRQVDMLRDVLSIMGIVSLRKTATEADDFMYRASRLILGDVVVYTTDKDLFQAVTPDGRVVVLNSVLDSYVTWDNFVEITGVSYTNYLDYRLMVGDSSDNLMGVKGIGPKLGAAILEAYESLDAALADVDGEWKASKLAHTRLAAADIDYIANMRCVVDLNDSHIEDLTDDICQLVEGWQPYHRRQVKDFIVRNGFYSMLSGRIPTNRILSKLVVPILRNKGLTKIYVSRNG